MFKSTIEFDSAVYNALVRLRNGENLNNKPDPLDQADYSDILAFIVSSEFVSVSTQDKSSRWESFFDYQISNHSRISRKGLQFIEQHKN